MRPGKKCEKFGIEGRGAESYQSRLGARMAIWPETRVISEGFGWRNLDFIPQSC